MSALPPSSSPAVVTNAALQQQLNQQQRQLNREQYANPVMHLFMNIYDYILTLYHKIDQLSHSDEAEEFKEQARIHAQKAAEQAKVLGEKGYKQGKEQAKVLSEKGKEKAQELSDKAQQKVYEIQNPSTPKGFNASRRSIARMVLWMVVACIFSAKYLPACIVSTMSIIILKEGTFFSGKNAKWMILSMISLGCSLGAYTLKRGYTKVSQEKAYLLYIILYFFANSIRVLWGTTLGIFLFSAATAKASSSAFVDPNTAATVTAATATPTATTTTSTAGTTTAVVPIPVATATPVPVAATITKKTD